jgi:hypothetical protein
LGGLASNVERELAPGGTGAYVMILGGKLGELAGRRMGGGMGKGRTWNIPLLF